MTHLPWTEGGPPAPKFDAATFSYVYPRKHPGTDYSCSISPLCRAYGQGVRDGFGIGYEAGTEKGKRDGS